MNVSEKKTAYRVGAAIRSMAWQTAPAASMAASSEWWDIHVSPCVSVSSSGGPIEPETERFAADWESCEGKEERERFWVAWRGGWEGSLREGMRMKSEKIVQKGERGGDGE